MRNDYDTHDVNGVKLEEGMQVSLTGMNWIDESVQGDVATLELEKGDIVARISPTLTLYVCGHPGKWDDWTVTAVTEDQK